MGVNRTDTHIQFSRLRNNSVDADSMVDVSQTSPLRVISTNGRNLVSFLQLDLCASTGSARTENPSIFNARSVRPEAIEG
jgi:hypothetical protein